MSSVCSSFLLFFSGLCQCFNIDVKHPRIFTGPEDALFGFSVLQHEADGEKSYVCVNGNEERTTNNEPFIILKQRGCTVNVLMINDILLKDACRRSLGRATQQQERRCVQMRRGRRDELKLQQSESR